MIQQQQQQQQRIIGSLVAALLIISSPSGYAQTDEDWVDCPLCADPSHFPQDPLSRFVSGADTWTCQSAFDLGNLTLPVENCTFWQSRGEIICQCAEGPPETNDCTLCEDGSTLPEPLLEVLPGKMCAEVQVDAKRDEVDTCIVYQQTIGIYCGCDNPQAISPGQEVCRLCGDRLLPEPLTLVSLVTPDNAQVDTACVELEFAANLPGGDCSELQLLYSESCCPDEPTPDPDPEDGAPLVVTTWLGLSMLTLLAGLFVAQ
mmetsp:Transcript_61821/g.170952  ORF Transcript_61821/g.170952 Transcript_61821/m.170952 type:complete len:260 (-) Transcript_61821:176-955(-)